MNNFNYTKVPGDLLYCDRRQLDDFDVDNSKSLNYLIEKEFDRIYGTSTDYEEFAKSVFNTAYYVCTMALADSHPQRRFGAYLSIVDRLMRGKPDEVEVVLSIILIQINTHNWRETKPEIENLALKIFYNIEKSSRIYYEFYLQVMQKYENRAPYTIVPPDSDFKCRKITMGVLKGTCSHWSWDKYFGTDMEMMLDFVFAIGKNENEQKLIASFLNEQTHSSFTDGAEHKYCFEYIDRQIYMKFHAEEEKAQIDAEIEKDLMKEYEQQWELDYYKDEFSKLKSENMSLHAEIEEIKKKIPTYFYDKQSSTIYLNGAPSPKKDVESLVSSSDDSVSQQFEDAQKTIDEQAQTINEQQAEIHNLRHQIEILQADIEGYKDKDKRLNAHSAALFSVAICKSLGWKNNDRQKLWPFMNILWAYSQSTSEKALREDYTQNDADKLAEKFMSCTPNIAKIIRELPITIKEENEERLRAINPYIKNS